MSSHGRYDELDRFNAANALVIFLWNLGAAKVDYKMEVHWYDFLETLSDLP